MNKKVKTITTWLAAAIFLLALAINIKVTLDDPFVMLSDEAIAQTTSSSSSSNVTGTGNGRFDTPQNIQCPQDQWTTVYPASETWTITVSTGVSFESAVAGAFKLISFTTEGQTITYTYTSETNSGVLTETYKTICNDVFYLWGCSQKSCRVL